MPGAAPPGTMDVSYVVLAIPVFFLLIGVELLVVRWTKKDHYRLNDSVSDLSCGMFQQILEVFLKTALFAGYVFLYDRSRLLAIPNESVAAWTLCFLGVDFLYYWFHRMSHGVNAFWAAHVVHHQSEEFNLAVALRQGALQSSFSSFFYLPLALIGFPPLMFLTLASFNTLYQFWIHTRTIGRLGPLEWVLNTPSNHRVHHGRDPKYIDKNLGGTFIIWDRLFRTYQREEEEPLYGITKPLESWNPVWANLHYWAELLQKAARARRLGDRLRLFVKPPGWQPEELGGFEPPPEVDRPSYRRWDVRIPRGLALYVFVQFVPAVLATSWLLFRQAVLPRLVLAAGSLLVVVTLACLAGLLERKAWAFPVEILRLLCVAALAAAAGALSPAAAAATLAGTPLLVGWLWRYRRALPQLHATTRA